MKKEVLIGLFFGIIANVTGSYLYIFFFSERSFEETLQIALDQDVLGSIVVLGAILNLVVFFIFLKKQQLYRARGVILATILAALVVLISKFL